MKTIFSLLVLMTLTSCASNKLERKIEEKASKEGGDSKALGNTIHDLISSSKTLSDAQKKALFDIIAANKQKADVLAEQSFKFRSVLVKELLSGKINPKEIDLLKKDIEKVESQRLKNTFDAVEKITNIVSNHPEKEMYMDHLLNIDRLSR